VLCQFHVSHYVGSDFGYYWLITDKRFQHRALNLTGACCGPEATRKQCRAELKGIRSCELIFLV
jgi:hypothetical protein